MKVKSESEVSQSCPTLSDTMDYSLPGSSIHGIFQARVLEWGAIAFSEQNRMNYCLYKNESYRPLVRNNSEEKREVWAEDEQAKQETEALK